MHFQKALFKSEEKDKQKAKRKLAFRKRRLYFWSMQKFRIRGRKAKGKNEMPIDKSNWSKHDWRKLVWPKKYIYSLFHVVIYLCLALYYKFKLLLVSTDDGRWTTEHVLHSFVTFIVDRATWYKTQRRSCK